MTSSNSALKMTAQQQGMSENELILSILSLLDGENVTEEIWKPLE